MKNNEKNNDSQIITAMTIQASHGMEQPMSVQNSPEQSCPDQSEMNQKRADHDTATTPEDTDLAVFAKFWQQQPLAVDATLPPDAPPSRAAKPSPAESSAVESSSAESTPPLTKGSALHTKNTAANTDNRSPEMPSTAVQTSAVSADIPAITSQQSLEQQSQAQSSREQPSLQQAKQKQRQQRWWLLWDAAGALVMAMMALWLLIAQKNAIGYSAAALLSLGVLGSLYSIWHVHVPMLAYAQWNSLGIIQFRYRRALLAIRYNRINQIAAVLLACFACGLWLYQQFQPQLLPDLLVQIYLFCGLPLAVAIYFRCAQRIKVQQAMLPHLRQLLADFAEHEAP
jgi:hypothetical protein